MCDLLVMEWAPMLTPTLAAFDMITALASQLIDGVELTRSIPTTPTEEIIIATSRRTSSAATQTQAELSQ